MTRFCREFAAGILRGIISAMMALGLGARRGTRLNRTRLWLWALVVAASGVVALAQPGCRPSCYKPADLDSHTDSVEEETDGDADADDG